MKPEREAQLQEAIDRAAASLGEYVDAVQIVCVVTDPDGGEEESMVHGGSGSFYARWAATRELVMHWDQYTKQYAKDRTYGDSEEGEGEVPDGEGSG